MVKRREVRGGVNNTQLLSQCSSMRHRIYNSITGQDCVCSFKNKCDGNKSRKRQKHNSQRWHLIKFGEKKWTISIYLRHEYEILNSPHPNKKPSLTTELVRNIVCIHNAALKTPEWHREKERNKKTKRLFSHTIIESSLPKSSTQDNWAQQAEEKKKKKTSQ